MYYKSGLKKSGLLKHFMVVPLFALVLMMSSATIRDFRLPPHGMMVNNWDNFYKYAGRAAKYPEAAQKALLQGTTMIKFSIVNGLIENMVAAVELGGGCDAAAMKCISSYKGFKEIKDGDYTLKFTFILTETSTPKLNENIEPIKGYKSLDGITVKGYGGLPQGVIDGSLNGDTRVYDFVMLERRPSFEGGIALFQAYFRENIMYPKKAERNGVKGKVFLSFVVEVDGSITNVKVERGLGSGIDEEALRVMRESPKWIPGMKKDMVVRVKFNTTVPFNLQ